MIFWRHQCCVLGYICVIGVFRIFHVQNANFFDLLMRYFWLSWCNAKKLDKQENRVLTRYSSLALKSSLARERIVMRTNLHDVFLHPVIIAIHTIPPDVWLLRDEFAILHAPKLLTQIAFLNQHILVSARHVVLSAAESLLLQIGVKLLESYQGICSCLVSHYVSHALLHTTYGISQVLQIQK